MPAEASAKAGLRPRTAPSFLSGPTKRKQKMAFDCPAHRTDRVFSFLMTQPVRPFSPKAERPRRAKLTRAVLNRLWRKSATALAGAIEIPSNSPLPKGRENRSCFCGKRPYSKTSPFFKGGSRGIWFSIQETFRAKVADYAENTSEDCEIILQTDSVFSLRLFYLRASALKTPLSSHRLHLM